jgi:hypothetical protein
MNCPVCRARLAEGPQCRRCKADLSLLFSLEEWRRWLLTAACHYLTAGEAQAAAVLAEEGNDLRRGPDSLRLLAVAHLLQRDFAGAWRSYQAAAGPK